MKDLVVDASVALKWFLADEEYRDQALEILKQVQAHQVTLQLPSLWLYEAVNGLRSAVLKNRIDETTAKNHTLRVEQLGFELQEMNLLMSLAIEFAFDYGLSVYDATYVALANFHDCDLVTGDERLYNQLKDELTFVRWIKNYT